MSVKTCMYKSAFVLGRGDRGMWDLRENPCHDVNAVSMLVHTCQAFIGVLVLGVGQLL